MRHSGKTERRTLENTLGSYVKVITVQVNKYEARYGKVKGQKVTNTGQGWLKSC